MPLNSLISGRRGFFASIATGAAALVVGCQSKVNTETVSSADAASPTSDEWVAKITGKHKQVFDSVMPANGWGPAFALNYLDTTGEARKLTDKDLSAVVVMRHFAMPLVVKDEIWEKYEIGNLIGVNDPKTNAPAKRNIFYNNVPLRPGLTYEKMITDRGVIIVACNLALKVVSGMAAEKVGLPKDEATKDFQNGLFKGVFLSPSGVHAVNLAQEAGCSYCYAG